MDATGTIYSFEFQGDAAMSRTPWRKTPSEIKSSVSGCSACRPTEHKPPRKPALVALLAQPLLPFENMFGHPKRPQSNGGSDEESMVVR